MYVILYLFINNFLKYIFIGFSVDRYQNKSVLKTHRLMSEYLFDRFTTPHLTKNSAYLESANKLMLQLIQYGFTEHWTTQALQMDRSKTFPIDIEKIEGMATPATPLSIGRIVGSLMIYLCGILVSLLVFAAELIRFKRYS